MKPYRLRRIWRDWLRPLLVIGVVIFSFRSAVADWHHVPTGSMEPNILPGDRILVNKTAYDVRVPFARWTVHRGAEPQRGDVVVFRPANGGTRLVKRVMGVPGDVVSMQNGRLLINGAPADYQQAGTSGAAQQLLETIDGESHLVLRRAGPMPGRNFRAVTIPPDRYLVLGDNRDLSRDSRIFGLITRQEIDGRVWGTTFSIGPGWAVRWSRTLRSLD